MSNLAGFLYDKGKLSPREEQIILALLAMQCGLQLQFLQADGKNPKDHDVQKAANERALAFVREWFPDLNFRLEQ